MRNMAIKRNLEEISKSCIDFLAKNGEEGLYEYLRNTAFDKYKEQPGLENEFIETSDDSFFLISLHWK